MSQTEPVGGLIRLVQTTDASGAPATAEYLREVRYEALRSLTETVLDFLRPLTPRETEHPGVFWYTDPAHGSGWLRMEEFRSIEVQEVTEAVRTLQLSEAIGRPERGRQEVLSFGNAIVPRTTNPYFMMVFGGVVLGVAAFGILRATQAGVGEIGWAFALVAMIVLAGLAIMLILIGLRRRAWWHRARAEAKRQGLTLPDALKVWN